jgi:hypothetical protein
MDSAKIFQLLVVSIFSAAIAIMGLNELSQRFIRASAKRQDLPSAAKMIRDLRGETNVIKPAAPKSAAQSSSKDPKAEEGKESVGEEAYKAVGSGLNSVATKLLPD